MPLDADQRWRKEEILTGREIKAIIEAVYGPLVPIPGDPAETARRYTFSGIASYQPQLFADLAPGPRPLKPVLDRAVHAGLVSGQVHRGRWIDVGTPERLAALNASLA